MIAVVETSDTVRSSFKRKLTIDCIEGCKRPVHFEDGSADASVGLFQPTDAEPIIDSPGGTGAGYSIRAYELRTDGARKVLETVSRTWVEFSFARDGAPVVHTTERGERAGPRAKPRRVTWTWRDGRFERR